MGSAYHPEWLVTFWLSTPLLNALNPHYLLMILAAAIFIRLFMKKKNVTLDIEDQHFRHLLAKKNVIEEQLAGIERKLMADEITNEIYAQTVKAYLTHLEQVKKELQQYT
ncbi:hypothetical protein V7654_17480 [Bacillus sp. JJ1609]|uniref:hypothetical protein n=1 Tax=Bacillus sp. JJ1609 TaxID=3122977 RepID=UPI00300078EB